jgi:HTH-type transcriptional regulator/antitoxin HigA
MATERIWPDIAIPPGEVLAETLAERDMSQAELGRRTGRPAQAISEIVSGEKEITPETAIQLGTPAHVWVRLEADYRYNLARLEEHKRLEQEAREAKKYPCSAMIELGWLPKDRRRQDHLSLARDLLAFFGVASLQQVSKSQPAAFRRSTKVQVSNEALAAWLRQGEREANIVDTVSVKPSALRECLGEIRALTNQPPEVFEPRLRKLLGDCGVAFVVVPHLPKTGAHGATRWLGDKAVLQVSIRYAWADVFWFTVFHELGHLILHGRREVFVEFNQRTADGPEKEADQFACDSLIPPKEYEAFRASTKKHQMGSEEIVAFARTIGIAPGVVVGRLQHDEVAPRSHFNGLRVRFKWASAAENRN